MKISKLARRAAAIIHAGDEDYICLAVGETLNGEAVINWCQTQCGESWGGGIPSTYLGISDTDEGRAARVNLLLRAAEHFEALEGEDEDEKK